MINLLLEISPILPNGSIKTLHLSSRGVDPSGTQFDDGYQWLPLITQKPSRTVSWSDEGILGETTVSYTPVVFEMSDEIGVDNEHWSTWQWQGAYCRMWLGDEGQPFSAYTQTYEGSAGAIERNGMSASLPILSIDHLVDRNLLTRTYGGTNTAGGPEGPAALRGVLKPYAAGVCANVEPILVDRVAMIYQYHSYGSTKSVDAVYENALSLEAPFATASTWAELAALTIPDGKWAAAPAIGAFRLANQPTGKITADVSGAMDGGTFPTTVGAIMAMMIKTTGVPADRIADTLKSRTESYCFYTTEQVVVGEELRAAMLSCGCASMPSKDGKFSALDFYALNPTPIKLNSEVDVFPVVRSYRQLAVAPPVWQVKVSGDRCWSTHSEAEISQLVGVISAQFEADALEIKDAKDRADLAQAVANAQARRVDEILADNVLDRGEKSRENATYESESAIKVEMMNRSSQFDVTAQRASYLAAFNNLSLYLNSLSPSFFDLTQSTPVNSDYDAYWKAYEVAKVVLANAMTGDASRTAIYDSVAGTPKTLGAVNADEGTKLGGIQTGATVGAPNGTNVGGRPAETVITNIDQALAAVATLGGAGYLDTIAPPIPTGLALATALTDTAASLTLTWNASTASDFLQYIVAIKEGTGNFVEFQTTSPNYRRDGLTRNAVYTAKIAAVDKAGNKSSFSSDISITAARDTVAPDPIAILSVDPMYNSVNIVWQNPTVADLARVQIRLYDATDTQVQSTNIVVASGTRSNVLFQSLAKATSYYAILTAIDTSANRSTEVRSANFVTAGGIVAADFTPNTYPMQTVTSLPTVAGYTGSQVVLFNGEVYRLTNGAWTKEVQGSDIKTGTIPGVALVPTTALPSTITVANVPGLNTIADAFKRADWDKVVGIGKPQDNASADITLSYTGTEAATTYVIVGNTFSKIGGSATFSSSNGNTGTVAVSSPIAGASRVAYGGVYAFQATVVGFVAGGNRYVESIVAGFETRANAVYTMENGVSSAAQVSIFDANTRFEVIYDGAKFAWVIDGVTVKSKDAPAKATYTPHYHIATVGAQIKSISHTVYSDNNWNSVAGANRPADNATAGENLFPNAAFGTLGVWKTYGGATLVQRSAGDPANYIRGTSNNSGSQMDTLTPVTLGQRTLYFSYWRRCSEAGQQQTFDLGFYDSNRNYLDGYRQNNFLDGYTSTDATTPTRVPANTWFLVTGSTVAPLGTAFFTFSHVNVLSPNQTNDFTLPYISSTEPNVLRNIKIAQSDIGAAAGDNLILNGDFRDSLNNYTLTRTNGFVVMAGSTSLDPSFFARMAGGSGDCYLTCGSNSRITVQAGRTAYISGKVRSSKAGAQFVASGYSVTAVGVYGGSIAGLNKFINVANQWEDFEVKVMIPDSSATAVMQFGAADQGSGQTSDISALRVAYTQKGSTEGAPTGTKVGTMLAEDVVSNITSITSDNVLSRAEKSAVISLVATIRGDFASASAASTNLQTDFGIDLTASQRNAANSAVTALNTFLSGLSPAWDNATVDTAIDGPTLRARVQTAVDTIQLLTTANQRFASTKSTWAGTDGAGKPENYATVGAPAGTMVGSTPAATVELRANDPASRINQNTVTIDGGKLTANTVTANQIASATITADRIAAGAITIGSSATTGNVVDTSGNAITTERLVSNLIDFSKWTPGATLGAPTNNAQPYTGSDSSVNTIMLFPGVSGASEVVLRSKNNGDTAAYQGGFEINVPLSAGFNPAKTYRYSMWVYKDYANPNNGYLYFGSKSTTYDNVISLNTNAVDRNPYWGICNYNETVSNKWYLVVGIVHGSSYTGGISGVSGVYDPTTGAKIKTFDNEMKWIPGATNGGFRSFQYYGENGKSAYHSRMKIEEVGNATASVSQMMATVGAPSGTMVGGTLAQTVESRANDPASTVNAGVTTITGGKITTGTVTALQIASQTITAQQIAASTIVASNIAANAITTEKLAAGAITADKIQTGSITIGSDGRMGGAGSGQVSIAGLGYTGALDATRGAPSGTVVGNSMAEALDNRVTSGLMFADTRTVNSPPSFYYDQYATTRVISEFKDLAYVGLGTVGGYGGLTTIVQWANGSGGPVQQEVRDSLGRYWNRISQSDGTWAAWIDTGAQINAGVTTINGGKITTGSVTANQIMANTITAAQIAASTITATQIAARTITAGNLLAGTITANEISANTITSNQIAARTIVALNLVANTITGNEIAANTITANNIAANTITANQIAGATITANQLAANAITADKIAANSVTSDKVAANTVTADKIASNAVTTDKLTANAVTADKMAANSVTANSILAGTISAAQLAAGAITATKLAIGSSDSIIPDSSFQDREFWINGNPGGVSFIPTNGSWSAAPGNLLNVVGDGGVRDWYTPFFEVEAGATYRIRSYFFADPNFQGWMNPVIHMPGSQWLSMKSGAASNPDANDGHSVAAPTGGVVFKETIITNPNIDASKRWQFRFKSQFTGNFQFFATIIRVSDATLIADGAITTNKITVGSLNGDRITAGTLDANTVRAGTVLSNLVQVANTGFGSNFDLGAAMVAANNPAQRINSGTTQIGPGFINISGGTTLDNWRSGTQINGGAVSASSITADKLKIGARGVSTEGIDFQTTIVNGSLELTWGPGAIRFTNGNGNNDARGTSGGNTYGIQKTCYIYWIEGESALRVTNNSGDVYTNTNAIMMATYDGGYRFNVTYGGTIIDGQRITTGSITADRMSVGSLSAISANIGLLRTAASGARTEIESNQIRVYDGNGTMRVRLGVW